MRAKIINIGNSLGIRIPKLLIEECNIKDEVEIEKSSNSIVIKPIKNTRRKGWAKEFKKMADSQDDYLLVDDSRIQNNFDREEWEW